MKDPIISIIVPTYNSAGTLSECLESIVNQTYNYLEVLIMDGLSTDRTLDIARSFSERHKHIKIFSEKDRGIYDAMNKGIRLAKGDWLYFMGSDDILYDRTVFSRIFKLKVVNIQVIYGNVIFKHSWKLYDKKFNWYKLLQKNICHQAIFYKSIIFKQLGDYNLRYKMLADWEFNLRWFNNPSIKREYTDQIVAVYNEDGACFNNEDLAFNEDFNQLIKTHLPTIKLLFWQYRNNKIFNKTLSTLYNR